MNDDLRPPAARNLLPPVLLLTGVTLVVALALLPFAVNQSEPGGVGGLSIAAAICLLGGTLAELAAWSLSKVTAPLVVMLCGMAIRMVPALAVCVYLAASGHGGRENLPFVGYLLVFYLSTLALETYLNVKRVSKWLPNQDTSVR